MVLAEARVPVCFRVAIPWERPMKMIRKTITIGGVAMIAASLAVTGGVTGASAQVDERLVITGEAAALNGESNMINLATAEAIAEKQWRSSFWIILEIWPMRVGPMEKPSDP
jgi:hypothetical protein